MLQEENEAQQTQLETLEALLLNSTRRKATGTWSAITHQYSLSVTRFWLVYLATCLSYVLIVMCYCNCIVNAVTRLTALTYNLENKVWMN